MNRAEYITTQIYIIPQELVYKYNLKDKAHSGYIFTLVTKGMYGLPQSGPIGHDAQVQHLEYFGYLPSNKTPGLWTNDSRSIIFTLLVSDLGVK